MESMLNTDPYEYFFYLSKNLNFIFNNVKSIKEKVQNIGSLYSKVEKTIKKYLKVQIFSVLPIRGGGKKRKKKNYTKPKKIKHVKKKIKLRVLSYYSVNEKSVLRLRKESPELQGCFMANHKNRITCGKTGITYIQNSN